MFATILITESIWVQRVETSESQERGQTIDRWTRWILAAGTAVVLVGSVLVLWS